MISMMLALSLVLGILPLLGVVWIFVSGMITLSPPSATVDGLFMSLILLALVWNFCVERVLGNARRWPDRQEESAALRQRNLQQRKRVNFWPLKLLHYRDRLHPLLRECYYRPSRCGGERLCGSTGRSRGWSECWHRRWCFGW